MKYLVFSAILLITLIIAFACLWDSKYIILKVCRSMGCYYISDRMAMQSVDNQIKSTILYLDDDNEGQIWTIGCADIFDWRKLSIYVNKIDNLGNWVSRQVLSTNALGRPEGIVCGANGCIVVASVYSYTSELVYAITQIDQSGKVVWQIARYSSDSYGNPNNVMIASVEGNICALMLDEIMMISPKGEVIWSRKLEIMEGSGTRMLYRDNDRGVWVIVSDAKSGNCDRRSSCIMYCTISGEMPICIWSENDTIKSAGVFGNGHLWAIEKKALNDDSMKNEGVQYDHVVNVYEKDGRIRRIKEFAMTAEEVHASSIGDSQIIILTYAERFLMQKSEINGNRGLYCVVMDDFGTVIGYHYSYFKNSNGNMRTFVANGRTYIMFYARWYYISDSVFSRIRDRKRKVHVLRVELIEGK